MRKYTTEYIEINGYKVKIPKNFPTIYKVALKFDPHGSIAKRAKQILVIENLNSKDYEKYLFNKDSLVERKR